LRWKSKRQSVTLGVHPRNVGQGHWANTIRV
jgi:hypothetical protein